VVLKEQRRLVLMPREAPLHVGHCKLLYEAAQLGAVIAPPMPAFYSQPQTIDDLINHSVGRVLDLFDLDAGILKRWEGPDIRAANSLKKDHRNSHTPSGEPVAVK
jgi:4-hydroxy-3-polyprenylbenzoate decarboxylase